jgi:hypothetical protein
VVAASPRRAVAEAPLAAGPEPAGEDESSVTAGGLRVPPARALLAHELAHRNIRPSPRQKIMKKELLHEEGTRGEKGERDEDLLHLRQS